MTVYLSTAFSLSMLSSGGKASVEEISKSDFLSSLADGFTSVVGHENTAAILTRIVGRTVDFRRVSIRLEDGDVMLVAVPQFRADQAREFTDEELKKASFRYFRVTVYEEGRPE